VHSFFQNALLTEILVTLSPHRAGAATHAPFSIHQHEDEHWLVKPDGERFYSLGVCVVYLSTTRETFSQTNPGYAAYENSNA